MLNLTQSLGEQHVKIKKKNFKLGIKSLQQQREKKLQI